MYRSFALLFTVSLALAACGAEQPFEVRDESKVEGQYPHSEDWVSRHTQFIVQNRNAETEKSCLSCHLGQKQARFLGTSVSCGGSCHSMSEALEDPRGNGDDLARASEKLPQVKNECTNCHSHESGHRSGHIPYITGACGSCHSVTAAHLKGEDVKGARLLPPEQSCFGCHSVETFQAGLHAVLGKSAACENCHSSHGSKFLHLLRPSTSETCRSCHEDVTHSKPQIHRVVFSEGGCFQCHDVNHSGKSPIPRFANRGDLCLSCHNQEMTSSDEKRRKIANMAQKFDRIQNAIDQEPSNGSIHNPAKLDDCSTVCHGTHSANYSPLLNERYRGEESYVEYKDDPKDPSVNPYALCFSCHSKDILNKEVGTSGELTKNDTKFRTDSVVDGQIVRTNWHWFHVVDAAGRKNKEDGRACGICHDPHGSINPHLLREGWKMGSAYLTMKYQKLTNGGSCAGPCHENKAYTRIE